MSADAVPYAVVKKLEVDSGALCADALARGVTSTLYLLPYMEGFRLVVLVNHQAGRILTRAMSTEVCLTLFGHEEAGEYEQVTTRKPQELEGTPIN